MLNKLMTEAVPEAASDPLTVDNHVYFYSGVSSDKGLALIQELRELDTSLHNERLTRDLSDDFPLTPIWLHINSGGGDLFAGFAIADQIKTIHSPVYSIVEGVCASAATLLSLPCSRRFITPNSFMLIHQLSSVMCGTHEQLKDEMILQDMAMDKLTIFYRYYTKLSSIKIKKLLERDSWMDSEQCITDGFVDEIKI